ncbi:MAG TPA: hypothetical protein VH062_26700 [Polyangiaceae bacterium]|nr:hypothetical protein [Polyangiaceae bacterium]
MSFALLVSGCMREEMMPVMYEIPIAGNSHGAQAAATCVAACRSANSTDSAGFYGCLGTCPDVRIVEGDECNPYTPVTSYCYTQLVAKEVPDDEGTANALSLLGDFLEATGSIAAAVSHHGGSSHHEHHAHHH